MISRKADNWAKSQEFLSQGTRASFKKSPHPQVYTTYLSAN